MGLPPSKRRQISGAPSPLEAEASPARSLVAPLIQGPARTGAGEKGSASPPPQLSSGWTHPSSLTGYLQNGLLAGGLWKLKRRRTPPLFSGEAQVFARPRRASRQSVGRKGRRSVSALLLPPPQKNPPSRFTPYLYSARPCVNSAQAVVILRPGLFVLGCQHGPMRNCSSRRTGRPDLCGNPRTEGMRGCRADEPTGGWAGAKPGKAPGWRAAPTGLRSCLLSPRAAFTWAGGLSLAWPVHRRRGHSGKGSWAFQGGKSWHPELFG